MISKTYSLIMSVSTAAKYALAGALSVVAGVTALAANAEEVVQPVVIELFTSQSCYSCPPAEAHLATLADNPDLVTLEWHVDYWDKLVYGAAGKWKDPYSSAEWTERQRRYNNNILGKRSAYTPQAVINGSSETVGSKATKIAELVKNATTSDVGLSVIPEAAALKATISAFEAADVFLVRYIEEQSTDVKRGENKGKTLASRHVVKSIEKLGSVDTSAAQTKFSFDKSIKGDGCAVLVQKPGQGAVLAARYCF